ncbi:zinc ribbon domain-containing protein [Streptomyces sp. NPDC002476]|uniref:zinc ribbon domain-containing protein n=1 Tax=Streptomyces sp. NPDC002476 TaxID=3364648 RepID=UPI0036A96C1E
MPWRRCCGSCAASHHCTSWGRTHWLASFDHSIATTPGPEVDQLFLGVEGLSVAFGVEEFLKVVDAAWREPEQAQPVAEGAAGFCFGVGGGVCSQCGVKDGPHALHVREWTCRACGAVLDRDISAAVDIAKAAGLAATACRAQVGRAPVPAPRSEAGTHSTPQPSTAR